METRPTFRSRVWVTAAALLGAVVVALAVFGLSDPITIRVVLGLTAAVTVAVLVWSVLKVRSQRRAFEDELAAWAAERARHDERLVVARDLHDIVSHGLGLITVRAASARSLPGASGEVERQAALADIEAASRATTTELRRMLTVLRSGEPAPLAPAATLADLPALVQWAADAGLAVSVHLGDVGEVSAGVQQAVCTVVEEALHNVLRHAGPTEVTVTVGRTGTAVVVEVSDAGPQGALDTRPGAGLGLAGLRERLAAFGGSLEAGLSGGGYRVVARIPDVGCA